MTSPAEAGLDSAPYKDLSSSGCMAALGRVLDADLAVNQRAAHEVSHSSSGGFRQRREAKAMQDAVPSNLQNILAHRRIEVPPAPVPVFA